MGSTHADWAWVNEVHWLLALTHFGGPPARYFSWGMVGFGVICIFGLRLTLKGMGAFAKKLHCLFTKPKELHSYKAVNPSEVGMGSDELDGCIGRQEKR